MVHDERVFPTRGQLVVVRGVAERIATRAGEGGWEALVIPRPGAEETTVLGGCKVVGDWYSRPFFFFLTCREGGLGMEWCGRADWLLVG